MSTKVKGFSHSKANEKHGKVPSRAHSVVNSFLTQKLFTTKYAPGVTFPGKSWTPKKLKRFLSADKDEPRPSDPMYLLFGPNLHSLALL